MAGANKELRCESSMLSFHGRYTLVKHIVLTLYHALLAYLGCGLRYKFWAFMCVTPLAKYAHQKPRTSRGVAIFLCSVAQDFIAAFVCFHLTPLYLHDGRFFMFPIVIVFMKLVLEGLRFLAFDFGRGVSYVVKMSWNPLDHVLVFVVAGSFEITGLLSDFGAQLSYWDYPLFVVQILAFDLVFGVAHYYSHRVPALWEFHKQHHEYRREDLNIFANFFAHIYDSIIMNIGFVSSAFLAVTAGGTSHYFMADLAFAGLGTHQKYVEETMQLCYYFEYDVLDLLFGTRRVSSFHNRHHHCCGGFYSAFGSLPDHLFTQWVPRLGGRWLGPSEKQPTLLTSRAVGAKQGKKSLTQ
mmetsp:Transcript_14444/g.36488  ORF Transcript_14444/g.36488 Transcript_14444/m.36488 type:complete len:353 (+) Transcript_14444:58-1116(+)